ncbi:hypothetical protein C6I20_10695 [Aeromicrobium sp. A1-2]|uniref:hypothetical protein n=1 Tax=Aeromicrobium sp. A1-2 TaxID=2107713 RepID=UPI000E4B2125|nr:hypothetical protein [Aeromicrobium sp. A1-2]AXT85615.1 hypothetical protein C6I20_10695 [Aeromicrobium sp. A1-2]
MGVGVGDGAGAGSAGGSAGVADDGAEAGAVAGDRGTVVPVGLVVGVLAVAAESRGDPGSSAGGASDAASSGTDVLPETMGDPAVAAPGRDAICVGTVGSPRVKVTTVAVAIIVATPATTARWILLIRMGGLLAVGRTSG